MIIELLKQNLKQKDAATALGISDTQLKKIIKVNLPPPHAWAMMIARYYVPKDEPKLFDQRECRMETKVLLNR
jgi:hypothetical protein